MGLAEVVRHLPRLIRLARRVRREALGRRPDVAVLVDSPDFNLPLARHLHRAGIPTVIYISPQLWAWRSGRVRRIRRDVARVLCILPFETDFYGRHRVSAEYVGHPLVDELSTVRATPGTVEPGVVALLPGSRRHEVAALLPAMAAAARRVAGQQSGVRVRLILAPGLDRSWVASLLGEGQAPIEVVSADRHRVLATSSAALVASGTATLECALLGVPMAVGYRLNPLSYGLARLLVQVPHVALVNLVAGRRLVPELVQGAFGVEALTEHLMALLGAAGEQQRLGLAEVARCLGAPGASDRAAASIVGLLEARKP